MTRARLPVLALGGALLLIGACSLLDDEPDPGGGGSLVVGVVVDEPDGGSPRCESVTTVVPPAWLDVLFVVDTGSSMFDSHERLAFKAREILSLLQASEADLHLALTTMDLSAQGANGRFVPLSTTEPRILTSSMPDLQTRVVQRMDRMGWSGDDASRGLEAALQALTPPLVHQTDDPRFPERDDGNAGFLRPEAALAVVFFSDDEDVSPGQPSDSVRALQELKAAELRHRVTAHAVASTPAASCGGRTSTRLLDVAQQLGGFVYPLCNAALPGWGTPTRDAARELFHLLPQLTLPTPAVDLDGDGRITEAAGELEIVVDNQVLPAKSGDTTHWSYDAQSRTIAFTSRADLQPGRTVEVTWGCVP